MVDITLPSIELDKRPLRWLFLDLNAYFASVEQQNDPSLRGKPIAVAPFESDATCAIAASYEAKRFGIKTGTNIGDAKRMCPELLVINATPPMYVAYHKRIIEVAETVLHVDKVCSIDEMRCRLLGEEKERENARQIALRMKDAIREGVGECMTCSVGLAPNSFLAKLATDMQKPDGLVILEAHEIEEKTKNLKITEFCGINRRMQARLNARGVFTVPDMYALDRQGLRAAFGSVIGERWWYLLRGYELELQEESQKTLGHSHVLSPDKRTDSGCREVLLRLMQKASARLRANGLVSSGLGVYISAFEKSWHAHTSMDATNDTIKLNAELLRLWEGRDYSKPRNVGIVFTNLKAANQVTPSLFDQEVDRGKVNVAVDEMNNKFGKNSVYLAAVHNAKDSASEKIAFNKTWLFSEGKGDNEWPDTFRGHPPKESTEETPTQGESIQWTEESWEDLWVG